MANEPNNPTWREKVTLAAIAAVVSGVVRAITTWILEY